MKPCVQNSIQYFIKLLIPLILLQGEMLNGSNVMVIPDRSGYILDTISMDIEITNSDPFIAFQCDVILPSSVQYLDNSAYLAGRENDHILFVTYLPGNVVRFFAFSPNNFSFYGQSGSVVTFNILSGTNAGVFPVELEDGIIADSLANNICNALIDGTLNIIVTDLYNPIIKKINPLIVPNPFWENFFIDLTAYEKCQIFLDIFNENGQFLLEYKISDLSIGHKRITFILDQFKTRPKHGSILLVRIQVKSKDQNYLVTRKAYYQ